MRIRKVYMKHGEFVAWYLRRYRTGDKHPYGIQDKAAADLAISRDTLRHHLSDTKRVGKQTARIIELLDENDRLRAHLSVDK